MRTTQGLWRGTLPGQLLTVPYTAVQFVTLQQVRYLAHQSGVSDHMGGKSLSFVSGAMAGAAATVASYPFDILRTTLAAQGEPKVDLELHYLLPIHPDTSTQLFTAAVNIACLLLLLFVLM